MTAAHMPSDEILQPARDRLDRAICALINPRSQLVNNKHAEVPSLYMQLYDAIPGQQGTGNHAARSMPPLWIDASSLLTLIDTEARKWQPHWEIGWRGDAPPTVHRLDAMRDRTWRPQDTRTLHDMAAQLEHWVIEIDTLLNPIAHRHIAAACPACGHKTALRRDSAGEMVRVPALQIDPAVGCTCIVCHATWTPDLYLHLCRVLGFPVPAGVLE